MRVGDLIEHDQRSAVAGRLRQIGQVGFWQGLSFQQRALMHGIGTEQAVEVARLRALGPRATHGERRFQAMLRVVGQQQSADVARRVSDRCLDGVNAIELHHVAVRLLWRP